MDIKTVYSNSATIFTSPYDVQIAFSQKKPIQEDGKVTELIEEVVRVIMSPIHAKTMLNILSAQIATYEKTFGEINDSAIKL